MSLRDIRDEQARLVKEQREVLDAADKDSRDLTADEESKVSKIDDRLDELEQDMQKAEAAATRRKRIRNLEAELSAPAPETQKHSPVADDDHDKVVESLVDRIRRCGEDAVSRQQAISEVVKEYSADPDQKVAREVLRRYFIGGKGALQHDGMARQAALQMDSDTGGGALVAPEQFVAQLIQGLDEMVQVRGVSTVWQVPNADSLGAPALGSDPADSDWTAEIDTGTEDSTMDFSKRVLKPHPLAKRLKASKTLIRRSSLPVESIIRQRLTFKQATTQESAFLTGHGANQPLGLFTASADGISTGRDVSTDNTTGNLTGDGLINAKYSLASQYHTSPGLRWMFHRDVVRNIRKLISNDSQYLWQPGLAGDRPNTILDVPYLVSEFAPNSFTGSAYVGIIGDFQWYWIAESLRVTVEVLSELYAESNQNGYIMRSEVDAMPVLEEAFARVQLASS